MAEFKVGDKVYIRFCPEKVGEVCRVDASIIGEKPIYHIKFQHFGDWYEAEELRLFEDLSELVDAVQKWLNLRKVTE
jgi:hypothetical protein